MHWPVNQTATPHELFRLLYGQFTMLGPSSHNLHKLELLNEFYGFGFGFEFGFEFGNGCVNALNGKPSC